MILKKYIGYKIKLLRERHKFEQRKLAKLVGLTLSKLRNIESGYDEIGILKLIKILEILNENPTTFFEDYNSNQI